MEPTPQKPWYKKGLFIVPAVLIAVGIISIASWDSSSMVNIDSQPATVVQSFSSQATVQDLPVVPPTTSNDNLSNDNYYRNSSGNEVHSPAYSKSIPAGASAQCRDGTYSLSQSRRGTCSHHGGVAEWL